ncbi:MAG: SAM-dependent methyltransferase [Actinomycetia bacterium]|nr:SAM-dependent methyltransferase [Actinomycetes bacterium]
MRGDEYQARFDALAATGSDVHGEATLVRSFAPARVLDAGCGTGRVAIELARHGIEVVGIDVDPVMLETARTRAPELDWRLGDLAAAELGHGYDVVVLAGNVLLFTPPGTEAAVVANVAGAVRPDGVVLAGFSLLPDRYDLDRLEADAATAGLTLIERWATWDRQPFMGGDYAVSAFSKP